MSASITIDVSGLDEAFLRLKPIFEFEPSELMTNIAFIGEEQTLRRIQEEKTAPDGTPWQPNTQGTSILMDTGKNLAGSLASRATAHEAEWGATWEYAHVHQDGTTIVPKNGKALVFKLGGKTIVAKNVTIPARPFVGLSDDNIEEIIGIVTDHFGVLR